MEFKATFDTPVIDFKTGKLKLILSTESDVREAYESMRDSPLRVNIKKWREKRSLDANAYLWLLLDKMARIVKSSKEELYIIMLERYGVFFYTPIFEKDIPSMKKVFRILKDRGEVVLTTESGKEVKARQCQCYKGSSLYDTEEMAKLLDGVVSEAENLGIDTITQTELREMKERWGV